MISFLKKQIQVLEQFSEHRLIQKIQKGDKEAFGKLYLSYLDKIYRYIFFHVSQKREIAEDLTQTVFFKAWQSIDNFTTEKGNFRAWLYRIAHNTVVDYYKTQKIHMRVVEEKLIDEPLTDVEEHIDHKWSMQEVVIALETLTDEQKTVITLKFIEGFSNQEIANIMDKHVDAIRAMQYRGLQSLRKILKK